MNAWAWLGAYVLVGYAVAFLTLWLSSRHRPLPAESGVPLVVGMAVLAWPIALLLVLVRAFEVAVENVEEPRE